MLAARIPDPASAVSKLIGTVSPAFGERGPLTMDFWPLAIHQIAGFVWNRARRKPARPRRLVVDEAATLLSHPSGGAFLAATLPHFAYHLTTTDAFSTADNTASLAGFGLELAVVIGAMTVATQTQKGEPDAQTATRRAPRTRSVPSSHL